METLRVPKLDPPSNFFRDKFCQCNYYQCKCPKRKCKCDPNIRRVSDCDRFYTCLEQVWEHNFEKWRRSTKDM